MIDILQQSVWEVALKSRRKEIFPVSRTLSSMLSCHLEKVAWTEPVANNLTGYSEIWNKDQRIGDKGL